MLLDADAITNLAGTGVLAGRDAPTVITPHAGELGRLLGSGSKEVSARRLDAVRSAADQHRLLRAAQGLRHARRRGREGRGQLHGERRAGHGRDRGRAVRCDRGSPLARDGCLRGGQGRRLGARARGGALAGGDGLAGGEHGCDRSARLPAAGRGRVVSELQAALRRGYRRACGMLGGPRPRAAVATKSSSSTPSSPTPRTRPRAGRGITRESGSALLSVADFLTLGNHAFDADGYREFLGEEDRVVRPGQLRREGSWAGAGAFSRLAA